MKLEICAQFKIKSCLKKLQGRCLLLCDVKIEELQEFANFYSACNIANGYHSMFEIALPFLALGIFSEHEKSCVYTDASEFYIQFLRNDLRKLPECNDLLSEYMSLHRAQQ